MMTRKLWLVYNTYQSIAYGIRTNARTLVAASSTKALNAAIEHLRAGLQLLVVTISWSSCGTTSIVDSSWFMQPSFNLYSSSARATWPSPLVDLFHEAKNWASLQFGTGFMSKKTGSRVIYSEWPSHKAWWTRTKTAHSSPVIASLSCAFLYTLMTHGGCPGMRGALFSRSMCPVSSSWVLYVMGFPNLTDGTKSLEYTWPTNPKIAIAFY